MNRYEVAQKCKCDMVIVQGLTKDIVERGFITDVHTFPINRILFIYPGNESTALVVVNLLSSNEEGDLFKLLFLREGGNKVSKAIAFLDKNREYVDTLEGNEELVKLPIQSFLQFNDILLNTPRDVEVEEREYKVNTNKKKASKKKHNVVRTYKCFTIKKKDNPVAPRKMCRTCDAWGVRGHYRHYQKSGKTIFVNPYTKGPKRNEGAYETKEYKTAK